MDRAYRLEAFPAGLIVDHSGRHRQLAVHPRGGSFQSTELEPPIHAPLAFLETLPRRQHLVQATVYVPLIIRQPHEEGRIL